MMPGTFAGIRSTCLLLLAVLVWGAGSNATAQPSKTAELAGAHLAYQNMEYERVIRLAGGTANSTGISRELRVEALELVGLSQLILGRQAKARRTMETLLKLSPGHKLRDPSGSPKLKRFFEAVRRDQANARSAGEVMSIAPLPSDEGRGGRILMLKAAIKGEASKVTQAMLRWRTSQNLSWNGIIMTRDKTTLSARLLLPPGSSAYQLLYQVEARDNAGNLLARAGSDSQPLKLAVAAGPPRSVKPVWHRWWFWTVLGTVVVGGVTAGAVLLTNESAPQGNLQPGVVHLR